MLIASSVVGEARKLGVGGTCGDDGNPKLKKKHGGLINGVYDWCTSEFVDEDVREDSDNIIQRKWKMEMKTGKKEVSK